MENLLRALISPDNGPRKHAEAEFDNSLKAVPDQVVVELAGFSALTGADTVLRSLAMILLRRVFNRQTELWQDGLRPETRLRVKTTLLEALQTADTLEKGMRRKLCDAIAIVAVFSYDADEEWPDLLRVMFVSVTAPTATAVQKENALYLFMCLADVFHKSYEKEFARIASILTTLASNMESNLDVRMAAVRAAWSLVMQCNQDTDEEVVTPFKPMVSASLDVIQAVIVARHPRCADPIDDLIDLADSPHVRLFAKKDIERAFHMMLELASIKKEDQVKTHLGSIRLLAVELIVTLMETRSAAVRKLKPPENAAVVALMPVLMQMMAELPELRPAQLKAWGDRYPSNSCASTASQHDDDEQDCGAEVDFEVFGASLAYLDRVVRAIKPKHVLPIVFAKVHELLEHKDDWRYPHTALLMLAHTVEFVDGKEPELGELCRTAALYATSHPYMRVRHAAFTLIARLVYDCAPNVQKRHSQVILAALLKGITDPVPRVQAHAATALINYCTFTQEYEGYEVALQPYITDVVSSLFNVLQSSPTVVQENVISALAGVARASNEAFLPFYSSMPILKNALMSLQSPAQATLRARLVDCIATIGKSVGKQAFLQDAIWLLTYLEQTPLSGDEPNVQHFQSAWMILGEVLGEDLGPFLHKIMPFTLQMANKPIEDEGDSPDDEEEEVDFETQQELYKVRTAAVDDRLLALEMLCSFASHIHAGFLPFLEPTLAIFFRDVREENCSNEDVRGRVAEGFPDLIRCALGCVHQDVLSMAAFGEMLTQTLEVLCVATNSEDSMENLMLLVRAIIDVLGAVHDLVISKHADACPDYVETCAAVLMQLLKDSVQRRALEFASLKCDTAEDELDEEAQADYDEKVQTEHDLHALLTAAFGALIKANPHSFIPSAFLSGSLAGDVFDFAHHVRLCHDQRVALFILDDMMEFASKETISPELLKRVSDVLLTAAQITKSSSPTEPSFEVAALVQAAVYGFGVLAERFGENWHQAQAAARVMVNIIKTAPKSLRLDEGADATCLDNCASSLLKTARACPRMLNGSECSQVALLKVCLDFMPLQADLYESRFCSFTLIQMMEDGSVPFLHSADMLPSVVRIFASVIGTDCLDDRHIDRALNLLLRLKAQMGDAAFNSAVNQVPKDQLENLAARVARRA